MTTRSFVALALALAAACDARPRTVDARTADAGARLPSMPAAALPPTPAPPALAPGAEDLSPSPEPLGRPDPTDSPVEDIGPDPVSPAILELHYSNIAMPLLAGTFRVWSDGTGAFRGWHAGPVAWRGPVDRVAQDKAEAALRRARLCTIAQGDSSSLKSSITITARLPGLTCSVKLDPRRWQTEPRARDALKAIRALAATSCADRCSGAAPVDPGR